MIIIGSQALRGSIPSWREPKDLDFIADPREVEYFKKVLGDRYICETPSKWGLTIFATGFPPIEFEITAEGNLTEKLYDIVLHHGLFNEVRREQYGTVACVIPEVVYTMKMSHRFLKNSKHFKKTMDDILELRRLGYGTTPEPLLEWYKARCKQTYDYKHPSLKQNKSDFFADDGVGYVYDHDSIHEAIKHNSQPAYEMIKADSAEVFCSKEKFFAAPAKLQLLTVLEEAYVLALERSQIPFNFKPDRLESFKKALEKICTSISSGWWREYAWEHYYQVLALYNPNYVDVFRVLAADGFVEPYRPKAVDFPPIKV